MAIKANIVIDQGTDFSAIIEVADPIDGSFDLTDYTSASQMRKSYYSNTYHDFTTETTGAAGTVLLTMNSATTATLEPGRYVYDVEVTSAEGVVLRVVEGIVNVTPGITR